MSFDQDTATATALAELRADVRHLSKTSERVVLALDRLTAIEAHNAARDEKLKALGAELDAQGRRLDALETKAASYHAAGRAHWGWLVALGAIAVKALDFLAGKLIV